MRIGYVVTHFPPLTETFIRREVLALCEAGDEVFVYAETVVSDPLVSPPSHPRLTVRQVSFGRTLIAAAARDGVEHFHGTLMLAAQSAAFAAARELSIPFSITAYSGHSVFTARGTAYREMSENALCAGIVVEDEFMRDWMVEHHGVDARRLLLIANSLDLDHYRAVAATERPRPRILSIARFVEKKGLRHLVEAFGLLRARTEAELHLIGGGPEEESLRNAAGQVPDVHFLGMQPEARCHDAYGEADIFALPCVRASNGDADGIPTVVLEAMACGLPVVVSDLLSAPCYVRDGVEGALVPPGDVAALASRLEDLCKDAALRARLGRNARSRVESLCDIRRNVERLRALFSGHASGRPLVSVCITAYNRERLVADAIESVLKQTYRPIEIIVADDGSTDGTAAVLARYAGRIHVVRNDVNRGCPAAKNVALRATAAEAKYVVVLDSDDRFLPQFVATCVDYLEAHPEHGLAYVNDITIDDAGNELYRRRDSDPWDLEQFLRTRHLRADTWMARRDLVMSTELHDAELPMDEDYDLFYQLLETTAFAHIAEPLVVIRRHAQQMTRDVLPLARCHAAHLVKFGFSPEYAYLRARRNPEWVPAIEEGIVLGKRLRAEREQRQRTARRGRALAIEGGPAVRDTLLRAGADGGEAARLEEETAVYVGAEHAIAFSSTTAALYLTLLALEIGEGDEVITTPLAPPELTNAIEHTGARVVFGAVEPSTLNLDAASVDRAATSRTAAILSSHFAGLPCDLDELTALARARDIPLIEEGVDALGAKYREAMIGGGGWPVILGISEGAVATTSDERVAARMRELRARHGAMMSTPAAAGSLPEIREQEEMLAVRERHARRYREAFSELPLCEQTRPPHVRHGLHRYVVRMDAGRWRISRDALLGALRAENIGAAQPHANGAGSSLFALPLFAAMTDADAGDVIDAVWKLAHRFAL